MDSYGNAQKEEQQSDKEGDPPPDNQIPSHAVCALSRLEAVVGIVTQHVHEARAIYLAAVVVDDMAGIAKDFLTRADVVIGRIGIDCYVFHGIFFMFIFDVEIRMQKYAFFFIRNKKYFYNRAILSFIQR